MARPVWFAARRYGYGWYPTTWQGWVCIAAFLVLTYLNVAWLDPATAMPTDLEYFLSYQFVLVVALLAICTRYGEKPRWRWGK